MPAIEGSQRQVSILIPEEIPPYNRGGGARTTPLVTRNIGATGFINGITAFAPDASIPLHTHNCDESVIILKGRAIAEIDGISHNLDEETATFIPAGVAHRFVNASQTEEMKILWIYASVDATRTIVETGNTRSIIDEQREDLSMQNQLCR